MNSFLLLGRGQYHSWIWAQFLTCWKSKKICKEKKDAYFNPEIGRYIESPDQFFPLPFLFFFFYSFIYSFFCNWLKNENTIDRHWYILLLETSQRVEKYILILSEAEKLFRYFGLWRSAYIQHSNSRQKNWSVNN